MKSFNKLFNEFFSIFNKAPQKKEVKININNPSKLIDEDLKRIIDMISNFKGSEAEMEGKLDQELGEPDEITNHIEDGMNFKKMVWNTPQGQFVKLEVTDLASGEVQKEESLEDRLLKAVEAEDYPLAIILRDQINAEKKNLKKDFKKF